MNMKLRDEYKLIIVFVDEMTPLKKQIEYLSNYTNAKDFYYLDFEIYNKGNLHKVYDKFLSDISSNECMELYNKNFVIKYNTNTKKCF